MFGGAATPFLSDEVGRRKKNRSTFPVLSPSRGGRVRHTLCHRMDDFRAGGSGVRVCPAVVAVDVGLADIRPSEPGVDSAPPTFPPDSLSLRGSADASLDCRLHSRRSVAIGGCRHSRGGALPACVDCPAGGQLAAQSYPVFRACLTQPLRETPGGRRSFWSLRPADIWCLSRSSSSYDDRTLM